MRRLALAGCLGALLLASGCGGAGEEAATGSRPSGTVVYSGFGSGSDELADELMFKPFATETGVKVKLDASSENIVAKLRAAEQAGNVPWSLIRAEEEDIVVLEQDGLIEPLPPEVKAKLVPRFGPGAVTDYGVPFIDYSSVLVCNSRLVNPCPRTMADFWDTERFKGPRTMYADGWLDNLVFALEADGVSPEEIFPLDVDRAFRKLDEIRDSIDVWWTNSEQAEQIFRDGEVALGPIWSGRAATLASEGKGIEVEFEGALLARELWVVPKGAPNAQAAYALMEWYATHPAIVGDYITERRNGIDMPDAYANVPAEIANALPTAPTNSANQVKVDFDWVAANRDEVFRRWQEWLTR
ncbi:MAG: ABC transporter substrate-binding protein [Gaiellaceae bacterium]